MILTETSKLWGRGYNRYYFLNGTRISETMATHILRNHCHEDMPQERIQSGWRKSWNIGPKVDSYDMSHDEKGDAR